MAYRSWSVEQSEVSRVGLEEARRRAAQRAAEAGSYVAPFSPATGDRVSASLPGMPDLPWTGGGSAAGADPGIDPPSGNFLERLGIGRQSKWAIGGVVAGTVILAVLMSRR